MNKTNENKNFTKQFYIRVLILIILILLILLTSFETGKKIYLLKNTFFDSTTGNVESGVARWNFNARIIKQEEDINEYY